MIFVLAANCFTCDCHIHTVHTSSFLLSGNNKDRLKSLIGQINSNRHYLYAYNSIKSYTKCVNVLVCDNLSPASIIVPHDMYKVYLKKRASILVRLKYMQNGNSADIIITIYADVLKRSST